MTTRKKLLVFIGIALALLAILFIYAQILASHFNKELSTYIEDKKGAYAVLAKSYQKDTETINKEFVRIANDKSKPAFIDKVKAHQKLFAQYSEQMNRIAEGDTKFVALLDKKKPTLSKNSFFADLNPTYNTALKKQKKLEDSTVSLERGVLAEKFMATEHEAYFANMAKAQTFISLEALTKLINGLASIGEDPAVKQQNKLSEYEQATETIIPGLEKILKASPMPEHPYYAKKRADALEMLGTSKKAFMLYAESLKNGNQDAKDKADALVNKDDKLLKYRTIVGESLLAPYFDIGIMARETKTIFSL
ncbi:TPA: hypothetical protein DIV49_03670 [Candidatus Saccharibacteria bacterium]|nr:hypothetical protein [Candidatus Saccharibacteria bacterium]HRJ91202.1 hypothetical protein [Candidatus Saccharibacteria bacterium]